MYDMCRVALKGYLDSMNEVQRYRMRKQLNTQRLVNYMGEGAFKALQGDNKELTIIPGAVHTDLHDNKAGATPYDKPEAFFNSSIDIGSD